MKFPFRRALAAGVLFVSFAFPHPAAAQSVAGPWEGTVVVDSMTIPFRIDITGKANKLEAAFINGDERVTSSRGMQVKDAVELDFDQYAETLRGNLEGGRLKGIIAGKFGPGPRSDLPFEAHRYVPEPNPPAGTVPEIAGLWEIEVKSPKGEDAWRFIVRQTGADVSAAILRVDGDTGALTGRFRDGKFTLSHFSGERPYLLEAALQSDGSLAITLHDHTGVRLLAAYRPADARTKGLPEPTDPAQQTRVADATKPFEFSFPDISGRTVSNTDARFLGKVVLVNARFRRAGADCRSHPPALVRPALWNSLHGSRWRRPRRRGQENSAAHPSELLADHGLHRSRWPGEKRPRRLRQPRQRRF
jgi:hypothetical protein